MTGSNCPLRIGLNSGQVIAGEVGSASLGYTAIGEQVGMAQRMESVAPPGGVMLSASTARLVEGTAVLGEPESVRIKGAEEPVAARRLLGMGDQHHAVSRAESNLVGRRWEMSAVEALLERAVAGQGAVVGVIGSPGIGKSRLVREVSAMAGAGHVDVFTAFCESHTSQVPFHAVARLLRAATGVEGLDEQTARDRVRDGIPEADPEDVLLFDDMLGIADPTAPLPAIDPDARRRRLTALVNAASLAREAPAVYVVEDAHWIDAVSESMLADFFTVIPQTPSLVLVTYRPDYEGALSRIHGTQTIALAPLNDPETAALVSELLGADPSVGALGQTIAERAAGNPFFAEEIVRELAERGVLRGERAHTSRPQRSAEVSVPATLQATIAARIDRLPTRSETHVERGGGHRVAVQPGPVDPARRRTRRCRPGGGPVHRSGQIHPPTRVCVPPSADSCGGLRGSAQVGSRRPAPAARRRHRTTRPRVGRRKRRPDRRTPRSGGRSTVPRMPGTCAPVPGPAAAISAPRGSVGNAPAGWRTRYRPTIRNARRCAFPENGAVCEHLACRAWRRRHRFRRASWVVRQRWR